MKKPIVVKPTEAKCSECMGSGYIIASDPMRSAVRIYRECKECKGKGSVAA